jgi:hypothetical protein
MPWGTRKTVRFQIAEIDRSMLYPLPERIYM